MGQQWTWDGVRFAVLHPPDDFYAVPRIKPNDLSCVLRIESPHGSVLLTGVVNSEDERRKAESIVRTLPGILGVQNALRLER